MSARRTFDVAIIGAGPVGASIAWHLAMRGCTSVLVLERATRWGTGSAASATGGFRAQFATAVNVRLSLRAREKLLRFQDETGVDPGYEPAGYLFLASDAAQMEALRAGLAVQRRCGLDASREVSPREIAALNPHIASGDVVGGSWCSIDGFIRPLEILRGYAEDAVRRGVTFELGCGDVGWWRESGRAAGVLAQGEKIAAGTVVIAAGAWSGLLATPEVAIPVVPERRQIAVTEPFGALPAAMPMTIDSADGFHLRVRDGRVLLLRPGVRAAADPFDTRFESDWIEAVLAAAHRRVPCLVEARIDRSACITGLYEMTPDRHALVGRLQALPNLLLATGNSGHGVMHAPALGEVVSQMILDGAPRLDVRALRPERFVQGDPNHVSGVI